MGNPLAELLGLLVGCHVANLLRIEHNDVSFKTCLKYPSFADAKAVCRHAGHFVDGLFELEQPLFAPIARQNTRERAPKPRMWAIIVR